MAQEDTLTQFNIDNGPNHFTTKWGQRKAEKCFRYWPILIHISFLAQTGALGVQILDLCVSVYFMHSGFLKGALRGNLMGNLRVIQGEIQERD